MTGEELVKMWADESDAANDCIIEILESYMEFADLVQSHAKLRNETILLAVTKDLQGKWQPVLEQARNAKKKAMGNEQSKTTE